MNIRDFINKQHWIFSKTYAEKAPHEYCLRAECESGFDEAVLYIRNHGFKAYFWRTEHIYLIVDDKLYWTMGAPLDETILINRCNISDYKISIYPMKKYGGNE